jgi:uncharacterized protein
MKIRNIITLSLLFINFTVHINAEQLRPLNLSEVSANGWLRAQIERDWNSGSFSVMWNNQFFPTRLGNIKENGNVSTKFKDESNQWVYTWHYTEMEGNLADAAVRAMSLVDNAALKSKFGFVMDFMVDSVAATQYVDSVALETYNGGFIWGLTCMQRAMLAHYEYSGDQRYYDAVKSMVDKTILQWNQKFDQGLTYFGRDFSPKGQMNHSLAFVDILQYLYRNTKDRKYVDFAFKFYDDFSKYVNPVGIDDEGGADAALHILLDASKPFTGHGPHTVEHLRMPLWLYGFAKDSAEVLKSKYELAVQNIPKKLYQSLSPSKGLVTDPNKHESINGRYSSGDLPYEYCSITETLHTLCYMNQLFADVESAENVEILFFNSAQGARFPDGKANTYLIGDNVSKASRERTWRDMYSALHGIRCCNLNAARIAPHYIANMWLKNEDETALYAMLHGPSSVETKMNGVNVRVIAQTNYPFENKLTYLVTANAPVNFTLKIRNPQWSEDTQVEVDGASVAINDEYITISKVWASSQQIVSVYLNEQTQVNKLNSPDSKDFYIQRGALIYTYPFDNEKTSTQARNGFPGYFHWDIEIPTTLSADYSGMRMLTNTPGFYETDPSFFRYERLSPFIPEYPFDFPKGKIKGRFAVNGVLEERELLPMGHATTRRTTFTPTNQLSTLTPVTIELQGDKTINIGNSTQYSAIVKSHLNTTFSNPSLTWFAIGGSITQEGIFTANKAVSEAKITVSTGSIASQFTIKVLDDTSTKALGSNTIIAYPTITNGIIYLVEPAEQVTVYSLVGRIVYQKNFYTDKLDISHLTNGCYLLRVNNHITKVLKKD